jgi:hypothetical protein
MAVRANNHPGRELLIALLVVVLAVAAATSPAGAWSQPRPGPNPQASPTAQPTNGLTGPTSYQSPQFGYDIAWELPWEPDADAIESNHGIGLDRLSLTAGTTRFQVFFVAAEDETPAEYAERFIDFRISYEPSTRIVSTGERRGLSWIAYAFESEGMNAFGVVEISLMEDGQALQVVEVMEYESTFDAAFGTANDMIDIEGVQPFRVLTGWPE